ncbi:DUF1398 family protein [Streptococcus pluranimalium]|uniref:DUF1398 family protein n=1 Tax=Streptococcus pluranimalium TaxID=82348 RepID=UPI003F691316
MQVYQSGQTTFPTFCEDVAKSGIAYWTSNLEVMTCTYYGQNDKAVMIENIQESNVIIKEKMICH